MARFSSPDYKNDCTTAEQGIPYHLACTAPTPTLLVLKLLRLHHSVHHGYPPLWTIAAVPLPATYIASLQHGQRDRQHCRSCSASVCQCPKMKGICIHMLHNMLVSIPVTKHVLGWSTMDALLLNIDQQFQQMRCHIEAEVRERSISDQLRNVSNIGVYS